MHELLYFACTVMVIIIILLCICKTKITIEKNKDNILKCTAVITVVLHYSSLWVDYLSGNKAVVENTMLFPIYPCNICMWLLLITAFLKNKDTFIYRSLTEFLAIAGTICGLIGLFANEIFISNPNFYDYGSLKGLLSHSTMIFGTLFILTQGYVKINALKEEKAKLEATVSKLEAERQKIMAEEKEMRRVHEQYESAKRQNIAGMDQFGQNLSSVNIQQQEFNNASFTDNMTEEGKRIIDEIFSQGSMQSGRKR